MTKSMAESMPMLPSLVRAMKEVKPWVLATPMKCQLNHSSEPITKGKPTRLTNWRTNVSMEPVINRVSTPPHSKVGQMMLNGVPKARSPMAAVPSRMTTSSKVVQPINCTMLSSTGRRAKALPNTRCISPALDRPLSQPSLAVEANKAEPTMEPTTMAMSASRAPMAGTKYAPTCMTSRPTPRLNHSEA